MRATWVLALVVGLALGCGEERRGGGGGGGGGHEDEDAAVDGGDAGEATPPCGMMRDAAGLVVDGHVVDLLWAPCPHVVLHPVEGWSCIEPDGNRDHCGPTTLAECQSFAAEYGQRCVRDPDI